MVLIKLCPGFLKCPSVGVVTEATQGLLCNSHKNKSLGRVRRLHVHTQGSAFTFAFFAFEVKQLGKANGDGNSNLNRILEGFFNILILCYFFWVGENRNAAC